MKKMTNAARKCECGSGYMPTMMDQGRNRWACRECAAYGYRAVVKHICKPHDTWDSICACGAWLMAAGKA